LERRDKENYYLDIADSVLTRGTCMRRNFGAIIVKNDRIISTGYTGAPRGRKNCIDLGYCKRESLNIPRGERYELCRSVHAECNCIISAARGDMLGAALFLVGRDARTGELVSDAMSCDMCKRMIINAGIVRVVIRNTMDTYTDVFVRDWIFHDDSLDEHTSLYGADAPAPASEVHPEASPG
jgi:dCMP deaminase